MGCKVSGFGGALCAAVVDGIAGAISSAAHLQHVLNGCEPSIHPVGCRRANARLGHEDRRCPRAAAILGVGARRADCVAFDGGWVVAERVAMIGTGPSLVSS